MKVERTITRKDGTRHPVTGTATLFIGLEQYDTFVHKTHGGLGWTVSEGVTGFRIARGATRVSAIQAARARLADAPSAALMRAAVRRAIEGRRA